MREGKGRRAGKASRRGCGGQPSSAEAEQVSGRRPRRPPRGALRRPVGSRVGTPTCGARLADASPCLCSLAPGPRTFPTLSAVAFLSRALAPLRFAVDAAALPAPCVQWCTHARLVLHRVYTQRAPVKGPDAVCRSCDPTCPCRASHPGDQHSAESFPSSPLSPSLRTEVRREKKSASLGS